MAERSVKCDRCSGSGRWPKKDSPKRCHQCGGDGVMTIARCEHLIEKYWPGKVADGLKSQEVADREIADMRAILNRLHEINGITSAPQAKNGEVVSYVYDAGFIACMREAGHRLDVNSKIETIRAAAAAAFGSDVDILVRVHGKAAPQEEKLPL